ETDAIKGTHYSPYVLKFGSDFELLYKYELTQNYPNPFKDETLITFNIPRDEHVKMEVFNHVGQKVRVLINESVNAGYYEVNFKPGDLPAGIYTCEFTAGEYNKRINMILTK
ncbi:MAG: T9SS type A sorting domain-containing protein, partial [Bacteroidales bacterium]|nr:T9SS type A sorting domain-containing protein [Bacteroidales bacterium]